jgi:mRNA capping enzyme, beta chain
MIPTTKTKDVVYTNDERASFVFDFESKRYSEQPAVVIKKDRIDDINIKAGSL